MEKMFGHSQVVLGSNIDRKSTRLNSSHSQISYAVFCLKKKNRFRLRIPLDTCAVGQVRVRQARHPDRGHAQGGTPRLQIYTLKRSKNNSRHQSAALCSV